MSELSFFELVGFVLKISGAVIVSVIAVIIAIFSAILLIKFLAKIATSIIGATRERLEKAERGEKQNKFANDLAKHLEKDGVNEQKEQNK